MIEPRPPCWRASPPSLSGRRSLARCHKRLTVNSTKVSQPHPRPLLERIHPAHNSLNLMGDERGEDME